MSLTDKLAAERRARLAAERMLELKSRELFAANRKLSQHALELSGQILEQREQVEQVRHEAEALKDRNQRTQAQLERAERLAAIHERRLWDSVETIMDGFAVFDRQDRLIAANAAWLALFDYADVIQPGVSYMDLIRFAAEEGIVDTGDLGAGDWIGMMLDRWDQPAVPETTFRLWNGRFVRLLDRRSRDGDMVCLAQDVTALKRREADLYEARSRAEAASCAKSAFLANMSHELRTPMNGVVSMVDLLLEGDLGEEQRLCLRTIRSSGKALLAIINDVLDFSKLEAGKMALRPEPFDMELMLHEVLTLVAPTAHDKALELHIDYDLFLPTKLIGDAGRLRQVLTNLIGNAVKFTSEGHVLVRVVGLEAEDAAWQIHVTVEDTGIGIAAEMQKHIFESFAQVEQDRNRSFEGTGLGLAISRQIVERMGGQIWVESEQGKGSCFGFRLTLPCGEDDKFVPHGLGPGLERAMMVGGGDLDQEILSKQLRQLGMEVHCAPSGSAALEDVSEGFVPQIVLIDERLPDLPGSELAVAVRQAGLHSATVLLCTDRLFAPTTADRGTVDAVLSRPILRSDLLRTLDRLARLSEPDQGGRREAAEEHFSVLSRRFDDPPEVLTMPDSFEFRKAPAIPRSGGRPPRRMRVMAAEDNRTNQLVFRKMVQALDVELTVAGNGREAVALFQNFRPDLIFMDISMPEMDGKAATREIRRMETDGVHVPIVAMTAHALAGDREEILEAGLDYYLSKPMRKEAVVTVIREACPPDCRPPLIEPKAVAE